MNDLIRQAKEYADLSEVVTATYYDEEHEEWSIRSITIKDVLDAVCDDYTVFPSTQQWTPVREGKPKDLQVVNITYINRDPTTYYDHIKGNPMVATAVYYHKRFYWYSVACVDVLGEYGTDEWDEMDDRIEVKAWMPLPTPWKEEE